MLVAAIALSQQGHINLRNSENRQKLHCELNITKEKHFPRILAAGPTFFLANPTSLLPWGDSQMQSLIKPCHCAEMMEAGWMEGGFSFSLVILGLISSGFHRVPWGF